MRNLIASVRLLPWVLVRFQSYRAIVAAGLLAIAVALLVQPSPAAADTATVAVGDIWYCDASYQNGVCETAIDSGDTVVWDFSGALLPHTTTACGASCASPTGSPLWDSGIVQGGGASFSFTFTEPGAYLYYCLLHGSAQQGRIVVRAPVPTATEAVDGTPGAAPATPAATSQPALPASGQGPAGPAAGGWTLVALLTVLGAVCGAAALRMAIGIPRR